MDNYNAVKTDIEMKIADEKATMITARDDAINAHAEAARVAADPTKTDQERSDARKIAEEAEEDCVTQATEVRKLQDDLDMEFRTLVQKMK